MRQYRSFSWKDTNLRIVSEAFSLVTQTIVEERRRLEQYIHRQPVFQSSLTPVVLLDNAPESAKRMAAAADITGLGPMASVAGTLAQLGAEAAMAENIAETIVENGGDIYIHSSEIVTIGLHTGEKALGNSLAFRVVPDDLPLALCSSSATMGHSLSLGRCDLATVVAKDAALADSAATLVGNSIKSAADLSVVLDDVGALPGILGIFAVITGKIGMWGQLPQLVRNQDGKTNEKITKDLYSNASSRR